VHELTVTQSILEITQRHAAAAGAKRVTDIYLVIGRLSSIIDHSVQFYWDMISEGTLAEGAKLHFRYVPTKMLCQECKLNYAPDGTDLACPDCGSTKVRIVAGKEFFVEAIEV
jgi:hydrogenase nickel incorporation protein HypA/HybF